MCDNDGKCNCKPNWNTTMPDCSWRVCESGIAWADKPYGADLAHSPLGIECSGAGTCNRHSGICDCFDGFTGGACQRMTCTDSCSGHGQCMTTNQAYRQHNLERDGTVVYTGWDAEKTQTCVCDMGYTGGKCELRLCPKGHDPIVPTDSYHQITLRIFTESGVLSGRIKLSFMDKSIYFPADVELMTDAVCAWNMMQLPNIKTATCSNNGTDHTGGGTAYTINITEWPTHPYENNIYTHRGRPDIKQFHCDTSQATSDSTDPILCSVIDINQDTHALGDGSEVSIPLYEPCSNRGICDMSTGSCSCYDSFYGSNCATFLPDGVVRDLIDVMSITVSEEAYTESVLHLADTVRGVDKWNSIVIEGNFDQFNDKRDILFQMDAWGDIDMNYGGINLRAPVETGDSGLHVNWGGFVVTGGMTIASGGLEITGVDVGGEGEFSGDIVTDGGLNVEKDGIETDVLVEISNNGVDINGGLTIWDQGLMVPNCYRFLPDVHAVIGGGTSICDDYNWGAYVVGGVNIETGGARIYDGVDVIGGFVMLEPHAGGSTKGVTIETGGLKVKNGGMTINEKGLTIGRGLTIRDSGLIVTGGISVYRNTLVVTGGISVAADGMIISNKLFANEGVISTGGTSIEAGGATVAGGVTIDTVGLRVIAGGLELEDGGVTITAGGLNVIAGGISLVEYDGLTVTGGITVSTGGWGSAGIEDDYEIKDGGLTVTGGFEYHNSIPKAKHIERILEVNGGISVEDTGLMVTKGGLTVGIFQVDKTLAAYSQDGVTAGEGLSIATGGLHIIKGHKPVRSIQSYDLRINNAGLETPAMIVRGGVQVTGGLTILTGGARYDADIEIDSTLLVTGGLSVRQGAIVTGGVTVVVGGLTVEHPWQHATAGMNQILSDGLVVTGGVSLESNGLHVTAGGISIESTGLVVSSPDAGDPEGGPGGLLNAHDIFNGLSVTGGLDIGAGLHVADADNALVIEGGLVMAEMLNLRGKPNTATNYDPDPTIGAPTNGLKIVGGLTLDDNGFELHSGMTVSGSLQITDGLSVGSGGINVISETREATTIVADGVTTDYLELLHGGLTISDGLVIHDTTQNLHRLSISITGGLTVHNTGLTIHRKGNDRTKAGIGVNGDQGVYMEDGGLTIGANGATVNKYWNEPVILNDEGLQVTGGITVTGNTGLSLTGGLTVQSGGMSTDHSLFKVKDGLQVTGGMSVNIGGLRIVSGDLEENVNGMSVVGDVFIKAGLHLDNTGNPALKVDKGMKIMEDGLLVDSGFTSAMHRTVLLGEEGMTVTDDAMTVVAGGMVLSGYEDQGERGLTVTTGDFTIEAGGATCRTGTFVTSGSITTASDRRLKRNIELLKSADARNVVNKLQGVFYNWNADHPYSKEILSSLTKARNSSVAYKDLSTRRVGFLAQDVQKALPDAVHALNTINNDTDVEIDKEVGLDDGLLGIAYIDVIPYLVTSMQGLDAWADEQLVTQAQAESGKSVLEAAVQELEAILARTERQSAALMKVAMASV
eukprot:GSChrysophyteH2.ASY1.ANO1.1092.1 assembled CDS